MNLRSLSLLLASTALLSACVNPIEITPCVPVEFEIVSVEEDTVTTSTGLRYIEGQEGTGIASEWCRTLAVHYEGFLLDGTKFDSSIDLGQPFIFTPGLGVLIDGFEQGVIGMQTGATRRLIIPPELGFGSEPRRDESGQIVVPGNSTLVYDIEVLEIEQ